MNIVTIGELPFTGFGEGILRKIRVVASPETTGEPNITIVSAELPPLAVSEGHTHDGTTEYILFDIGGGVELDGVYSKVPPGTVVTARPGVLHECRNLSATETLRLYCVFTPRLKPYGGYGELMARTKAYFEKKEGAL